MYDRCIGVLVAGSLVRKLKSREDTAWSKSEDLKLVATGRLRIIARSCPFSAFGYE
jgi:hypothetical protein